MQSLPRPRSRKTNVMKQAISEGSRFNFLPLSEEKHGTCVSAPGLLLLFGGNMRESLFRKDLDALARDSRLK